MTKRGKVKVMFRDSDLEVIILQWRVALLELLPLLLAQVLVLYDLVVVEMFVLAVFIVIHQQLHLSLEITTQLVTMTHSP